MPFQTHNSIKYFTFSSLSEGIRHAILTRQGGCSPSPWRSLNMGGTVGDDIIRVGKNRQLGFDALCLDINSLFDVWQVHGTNVVCAREPRNVDQPYQKADIILTDQPGVTLMMRFADCTPIMLLDPIRKVAGLVHAGWLGTVNGAVKSAIEMMSIIYGCKAMNILAGIGPSIGPDHYEVGEDVVAHVRETFGEESSVLQNNDHGKMHFDLWQANRILLERCGVTHIEIAGICTACHLEDWFSYRAEKGRTGRFGAMISLEG